jgi:hypothetical protein
MNFILSQLCLAAGLHLAVQAKSPVGKVVELINELKAKIETDQANEEKIYSKYACWCEATTQRKADAIDAGKAQIGKSTTTILMHKGMIATLESEIAEAEANIATNEQAMKKLTGIRETENSEYQSQKDYMETTLNSLHNAIGVLSGAGTGGDGASKQVVGYGDGTSLLRVASKVRTAILDAPQLDLLSDKSSRLLKSFLEDPPSFLQGESRAPQSATIMGILKDMYDTFGADLEKSNQEESDAQKSFEDEIAAKTRQNKLMHEMIVMKEGLKADDEKLLNEEEQKLEATQEQLKMDEDIFSESRTACKEKSDDWDARQLARTEQMVGINKALDILTSDAARATFQSATGTRTTDTFGSEGVEGLSFVQTEEDSNSPPEKAFRVLQNAIGNSHNLKLARIAAEVRSTTMGHFDSVIASLDGQLEDLHAEAAEDVTQRDWCSKEQTSEERNKSDQEYLISQLEAKIARAKKKRANLVKEKEETEASNTTLAQMYAEATADRTAESGAYEAAKADDIAAVGLLEDAIAAFTSYGDNKAMFLQVDRKKHVKTKHVKKHTLLKTQKKQPVFEVSEDQAPEATFASDQSGQQNGITTMMTNIKEDLESEIALAIKAEAKAVFEFEELTNSTIAQHIAYTQYVTELDSSISTTDEEIEDLGTRRDDTNDELSATIDYLKRIEPNCEWIKGAFTKRAEAREKEAHGLMEAKAILSGGSLGLLQSKHMPLLPVH